MAMQLALSVVTGEPSVDESGAGLGIAGFEIAMRPGMRGVGIMRIERQRPLDLTRAGRDIAGLDTRPAEIGQKPPILVPLRRRQALQQSQPRFVVIDPAAE